MSFGVILHGDLNPRPYGVTTIHLLSIPSIFPNLYTVMALKSSFTDPSHAPFLTRPATMDLGKGEHICLKQ